MKVRIFTAGPYPIDKGTLELEVLPRSGDALLARDPGGPAFYFVHRVLLVEGGAPIAFVALTAGEGFEGLDLAQVGLTEEGSLRSMAYSPFDDGNFDPDQPLLGL